MQLTANLILDLDLYQTKKNVLVVEMQNGYIEKIYIK